MRVLVVDEWIPYPLESGKKIRTFSLFSPLAQYHEITYLCRAAPEREGEKIEQMKKAGFRLHCVPPIDRFRTPLSLALGVATNLLSPTPLAVRKHATSSFFRELRRLLSQNQFDIIHCEWTHYAYYLPGIHDAPKFLCSHNVECISWRRLAEVERNPARRAALHLEWLKMRSVRTQGPGDVRPRGGGLRPGCALHAVLVSRAIRDHDPQWCEPGILRQYDAFGAAGSHHLLFVAGLLRQSGRSAVSCQGSPSFGLGEAARSPVHDRRFQAAAIHYHPRQRTRDRGGQRGGRPAAAGPGRSVRCATPHWRRFTSEDPRGLRRKAPRRLDIHWRGGARRGGRETSADRRRRSGPSRRHPSNSRGSLASAKAHFRRTGLVQEVYDWKTIVPKVEEAWDLTLENYHRKREHTASSHKPTCPASGRFWRGAR